MATGKKAKDLFARTKRPKIDPEPAPRFRGRPGAGEPYQKVTVVLFDRQVLQLDKLALAIRERTGKHVSRAELIRAFVERGAGKLDPEAADFDRTVRALLD